MDGSDDRHGTDGTAPMDGRDRGDVVDAMDGAGGMDGAGDSDRNCGSDRTGGMDDGAIAGAVRGVVAMEASREVLAARVTALRTATSAAELADRDRCGAAMAEADARILLESIEVLDRLGMTSAAMACSYVAREEGLLPAP
ncbi:hypothetical protein ACQI4E_30740 [Streptomyces sp. CA-252508]|uniref:hypothetical protein n=1 Tax=Streptomyces sp. CA-252508 TaxID=3418946 RepID=UPI003D93850C